MGLAIGALLFVVFLALPVPGGFTPAAWQVIAVVALMAALWITEALPLPVTALVPLVAFPALGVGTIGDSAAPYANPLVFLLLGGFMLGLAFERSGMHRRIAIAILRRAGSRPDFLIGGFMLATAGLSMWISNTAAAAMMLPIALSVLAIAEGEPQRAGQPADLAPPLLLAVAFGANIGGMSTLIGTPPNALLSGYMNDTHGTTVGFARWMAVAAPVAAVLMVAAWLVLTRVVFRVAGINLDAARRQFDRERHGLGPPSTAERRVMMIGLAAIAAWFARPFLAALWPGLGISDAGIAVAAALALFLVPAGRGDGTALLDWAAARDLPWGVLLLVGGGLSVGAAIDGSGLAETVSRALAANAPASPWAVAMVAVVVAMLASHVASNTATAAALVPLLSALATRLDQPPMQLAMPAVLALSCAFMLPVATPPNAIVYGTGRVTAGQMLRAGTPVAAVGIVVIGAVGYPLVALVFGAG